MGRTRAHPERTQKPSAIARLEPKLEIPIGTFSRKVVLHLVNESIVPALVEEFLRSKVDLPVPAGRDHNVSQP
jgi:hypothetical protein